MTPLLNTLTHFLTNFINAASKVFCVLFILLVVVNISKAQSSSLPDLIPYRNGKHWGYKNKDGKVVIKAKYMAVDFFKGDTALVFIRKKLQHDEQPNKEYKKDGFINNFEYIHLYLDNEIVASVRFNRFKYKPECYYINKEGYIIGKAPLVYGRETLTDKKPIGHSVCDNYGRTGYENLPMILEDVYFNHIYYYNVWSQEIKNPQLGESKYRYGLLGPNGDTLTPALYSYIKYIIFQSDTFLLPYRPHEETTCVLNTKGEQVLSKKFEDVFMTKYGYFLAQKNYKYYYFNRQGKLLIRKFDDYMLLPNNTINIIQWPIFSFHSRVYIISSIRDKQSAIYSIDGKKLCKFRDGYKFLIKDNIYGVEKTREYQHDEFFSNFLIINQ